MTNFRYGRCQLRHLKKSMKFRHYNKNVYR